MRRQSRRQRPAPLEQPSLRLDRGCAGAVDIAVVSPGEAADRADLDVRATGAKFATPAVQFDGSVHRERRRRAAVRQADNVPCCLLNATGIVTGVAPPFCGSSVIRPKYWPGATAGALIVIGKVDRLARRLTFEVADLFVAHS